MKRTALAGRTRLNYLVCTKYLDFLKSLSWVEGTTDGGELYITKMGLQYSKTIASYTSITGIMNHPEIAKQSHASEELLEEVAGSLREAYSLHKQSQKPHIGNVLRSTNGSYKILLIDDETDILLTYKSFLQSAGYQVDAFQDSRKAMNSLALIGPDYYDLVITDVRMSNFNGLQIYQHVTKSKPDAKFIFVTALDAIEEILSVFPNRNSILVIRKPVHETNFLKAVKRMLPVETHTTDSLAGSNGR